MPRKLFVVARDNTLVYGQLMRTVGREPGVTVIYDRRPAPPKSGRLRRLASALKRAFGLSRSELDALGRRQRAQANEELKRNGWTVVHLDEPAGE